MATSSMLKKFALPALLIATVPMAWAQTPATGEAPAPAAAIPGIPGGAVPGAAIQGGKIDLQVGKSMPMADVQSYDIANKSIVTAEATAEGGLILSGKNAGSTTLMVRKTGVLGIVVYEVNVTGVDVENVLKTVKAALGGIVGMQITQEGNVIVLQGDVANRDDGMRIDHQKDVFGTTLLDLTKRTYLQAGLTLMKAELAKSSFRDITAETQLNSEGNEVLILRGKVYSAPQKETLMGIAQRFFDDKRIVDQITIDSPGVEVDLDVYSFDLNRVRSLGSNTLLTQLTHLTADGWTFQTGPTFPITPPQPAQQSSSGGSSAPAIGTQPGAPVNPHTLSYPAVTLADSIDQNLNALNDINAVVNESHQHASVRSGETANVSNITEDNIQVSGLNSGDLKQVTFGQDLTITPTIINDKTFATKIGVELSNRKGVSGETIERRKLASTFNSDQGQTVVLGGNRQITSVQEENSTPFMAQIPIINWWFKKKDNNHDKVVQVFMMTLTAPNLYAAQEQPLSSDAQAIKQQTMNSGDQNTQFLKNRQRWEAEGLKTLWTGKSRFD